MNSDLKILEFEHHYLAFESAWRKSPAPDLASFVESREVEVPKSCLLELIKIDLEHQLRKQNDTSVNQYWKQFSSIVEYDDKLELLKYELKLRQKLNLSLGEAELKQRFDANEIQLIAQISTVIEDAEKTKTNGSSDQTSTAQED